MSTYIAAFGLILSLITGVISLYEFGKNHKSPGFFFALCAIALITGTIYLGGLSSSITDSNAQTQSSSTPANQQNTPAAPLSSPTPVPPTSTPPTPTITPATPTPTPSGYVQLKSYYSGTASGYADASITFTLKSEDQQGNLSMQTTFQQQNGSQQTAIYNCQQSVTTDRNINLQCTNVSDPSYVLTIQGYVYPDGHMEGTETATNTHDSSYNHVYSWTAY